ncbi:MAG: radical SAM protein [Endomicrobiaceae bacterium]|nr:radical SAM protein [Endomicrobiaceae bacterium]
MEKSKLKCLLAVAPFMPVELPSIGLPYISSALKKEGYTVTIEDLNQKVNNLNKEHMDYMDKDENQIKFYDDHMEYFLQWIDEYIIKSKINVVGFTVWASNLQIIKNLSKLIKQKNREIIIVCGGPGHHDLHQLLAKDMVDIIVRGEGENTIFEIFDNLVKNQSLHNIKGITFLNNNMEIIENSPREEIHDINKIDFPDLSDLKLFDYEAKEIPLLFSRGCTWRCKFCTVFYNWDKFRTRTADNIFEEILLRIKQYDRQEYKFQLYDCACNQDIKMLSELCDKIIGLNLPDNKISFVANAKIMPDMDYKLLEKMKKAGFRHLRFGIESGSDNVLKLMSKPFKSADAEKLLKNASDLGIDTVITMIVGFPGETESDWDDTVDFLERISPYVLDIFMNLCSITRDVAILRFKDIVDLNYDEAHHWNSKDMKNTYEIRKLRLKILDERLTNSSIKIIEPMRHYSNK